MVQVLKILRRKDELIALLQSQLEDSTKQLHSRGDTAESKMKADRDSSGQSKDFWTGRDVQSPPFDIDNRISGLQAQLDDCRDRLQQEREEHSQCRKQLAASQQTVDDLRMALENSQQGPDKTYPSTTDRQQQQELRGLREKTLDQSEQIQVTFSPHTLRRSFLSLIGKNSIVVVRFW